MAVQTTTTTPTGWAADAAFSNWQRAQQIAAQPYNPYQGNMLAGWNGGQMTGYDTAMNSAGVGIPSMQQAQGFATQAGAFQPQQVSSQGYTPTLQNVTNTQAASAGQAALPGFFGTQAASAGPASLTTPAQMQAASAGPANLQNVLNTRSFSAGPASQMTPAQMQAAQMSAASAGPAQQMSAAQMGRGDVRNVAAQSFPGANLDSYMNPYIGSVVNSTLGQLGRQNDIINSATNAKAAAAGAFGGGRQAVANAENNRAFLDTAGQVTSNLYNTGFNTAQGAIQADQNRAMQADLANQGQDWNVGSANLANRQNSAMQNMLQGNQMSQFNAGLSQAANLQNSNLAQSAAAQNATFAQNASAANQAANNQMTQYNTTNQQNAEAATIAAHNAASQSQAQMANQMQQYNAGLQQQANAANAGYGQESGLWNAGAQNALSQYNAGLQQTANSQTSAAQNAASLNQANAFNNMSQYNAGLQQTANSQTAAAHNVASAGQAAAVNEAGQFGAKNNLAAQIANQQAGQYAAQSQIQAANALNGMGLDAQKYALNNSAAQMGAGTALTAQQQLGLDQQYNEWARQQNYPLNQLGILQQGLNGYSSGQSQTSPYYSNTGAQIAAGVLGAGALGVGALRNGSDIVSGGNALYNWLAGSGGASQMPNSIYDAGAMSGSDLLASMGF